MVYNNDTKRFERRSMMNGYAYAEDSAGSVWGYVYPSRRYRDIRATPSVGAV